jgi:hypothetical protein
MASMADPSNGIRCALRHGIEGRLDTLIAKALDGGAGSLLPASASGLPLLKMRSAVLRCLRSCQTL